MTVGYNPVCYVCVGRQGSVCCSISDEGGLFGLDKHHFVVGISGQEVFSEQALGQSPVCGEQFSLLEDGVNPVYFAGCGGVFDTVSVSRVVLAVRDVTRLSDTISFVRRPVLDTVR